MAVSSLSFTFVSNPLSEKIGIGKWTNLALSPAVSARGNAIAKCSMNCSADEEKRAQFTAPGVSRRRAFTLGIGGVAVSLFPSGPLLAEGVPKNYNAFVDKIDGYSYYYPSDWREFDFTGHDSAFKDRQMQLQNVRLSFIPTTKADIHDLGPMDEVIEHLVTDVYSAPNQVADVLAVQEKNIEGRTYYTFEYILTSPNFARAAFATIAIGNGRYYTLIVGANERRWRRYRNQLKVVADSFRVLDI